MVLADSAMGSDFVGLENLGENVDVVSGLMRGKVAPNAGLKSALEALDHRRFLFNVRGEVVDPFPFEESFHLLIKQFFARVCLQSCGLPGGVLP